MEDIDRGDSIRPIDEKQKEILRNVWRSANPERASRLIEQFLRHNRRRAMMAATEASVPAFLKKMEDIHDEALNEKLSDRFADPAERQGIINEIRETRGVLRQACESREPEEYEDSPELLRHIEQERMREQRLRQYLRDNGVADHLIPEEPSEGLIRVNAMERMRGLSGRWLATEEAREMLEKAIPDPKKRRELVDLLRKDIELPPASPGPSFH